MARVDGQVALVPFVLPGEEVEANVQRAKNDLLRGHVVEIVSPSEHRIAPACPYFYRCGGCQYQHAVYDFQVEQKRSILLEVLRRVGKIEYAGDVETISSEPWQYRNRVQLHIDNGQVGYFELGSHHLCPIERCPIASPKLNEVIGVLSTELPKQPRFETDLELFTNETDVQFLPSDRVPRAARELLDGFATTAPIVYEGFQVSRRSFFQVNRFLIDRLVDVALSGASGARAIDLYSGVGLFSRAMSATFENVTAVEASESAYRDLQTNVPNAVAAHSTAEQFLTEFKETPDLILADPPRAGLGKQNVTELSRLHAPQLRIVSCDPATLSRDLRGLLDAGYRIERMILIDLFPQTFHLETVVHLVI